MHAKLANAFAVAGLLVLTACPTDDDTDDTFPPTTPQCDVTTVASGGSVSLYSIWGNATDNVYMVGADAGAGPVVLHWNGTDWNSLDTGTTGDLWWVWGDGADNVWFSGAGGRVVHHVISAGTFTETQVVASEDVVLFGIWGSSADDIWTVGGNPTLNAGGTASHWDGTAWTEATDLPTDATMGQIFKVWGRSATDVTMVGSNALLLNYDGAWTVDPPPVSDTTTLFTVSGGPDEIYAVGGFGSGVIARHDGTAWVDDSPTPDRLAPGLNGVFVSENHGVVAVGNSGALFERSSDGWNARCSTPETILDYHGSWIDPEGGVWAVGGALSSQIEGIIVYAGPNPPATLTF